MYKVYKEEMSNYSYVPLGSNYYRLLLREYIDNDSTDNYEYNEYDLIITCEHEFEIPDLIADNFDTYLEKAKFQEKLDNKDKKIKSLENKLSKLDYKVLKDLENYVLGITLPYEFSSLIYKRQEIRDNINNLGNSAEDLTEDSELSQAISRKIKEICSITQSTIVNGIVYKNKNYSLNITDQINLMFGLIIANIIPDLPVFPYHADNYRCEMFTMDDIKNLAIQGILFKTYHTTYYNLLKCEILEMTSVEQVNSVYYGIELFKDEDKEILNNIQSLMGGMFENEGDTK